MTAAELVAAGESVGLRFSRLGEFHGSRWCTWTTDAEKANAMRDAGATVLEHRATRWTATEDNERFAGWSIEVRPDVAEDEEAAREKGSR